MAQNKYDFRDASKLVSKLGESAKRFPPEKKSKPKKGSLILVYTYSSLIRNLAYISLFAEFQPTPDSFPAAQYTVKILYIFAVC
jgi:hypothetical protein